MKKIEGRAVVCKILALLLAAGMALFLFRWFTRGGSWVSAAFNRHLYNNRGELAAGTVLDADGDVLTTVDENGNRTYYDGETVRKATLHAVGDLQGSIGTGALNAFADKLTGYNFLNGAFGGHQGASLYLTLDARYNYEAYQALNGRAGTVAVYNYKTGDILCMVSSPSYDPLRVPEDIETNDAYRGAYLNRFLSSTFVPGSVFKTVTLAAAIEKFPDLDQRTWDCAGSVEIDGEKIVCSGVHGEQGIQDAFANSCNVAFAQIARDLGGKVLEDAARKSGLLGASYDLDGLPSAQGTFEFDGITDGELGWAGVGQHKDLVNPCALMVYMGAIANGGRAAVPRIIGKVENSLGLYNPLRFTKRTGELIRGSTAKTLAEYMANNVEQAYGVNRFPNMDLCAKSGTAEVGEGQSPHAWFAGFLRNEDAPYAFVVLVENGGGGSSVAGTVAGRVLDIIVNGY